MNKNQAAPTHSSGRRRVCVSGRELFYMMSQDRNMMVAEIDAGPSFTVGQRRVLFRVGEEIVMSVVQGYYDITADDQRFLMRRHVTATARAAGDPMLPIHRLILTHNWFEELKEKFVNLTVF